MGIKIYFLSPSDVVLNYLTLLLRKIKLPELVRKVKDAAD